LERVRYQPKIVLHCATGYVPQIDALVEAFRRASIKAVCVVGVDCGRVEDIIDELVVGDGSYPDWNLLTTSHPNETLAEVVAFARALTGDFAGEVQLVEV
jgi:hypothetical protein